MIHARPVSEDHQQKDYQDHGHQDEASRRERRGLKHQCPYSLVERSNRSVMSISRIPPIIPLLMAVSSVVIVEGIGLYHECLTYSGWRQLVNE